MSGRDWECVLGWSLECVEVDIGVYWAGKGVCVCVGVGLSVLGRG